MGDGHPMCAAGEHDFCRVIDGITIPAPVVCSRCGQPAPDYAGVKQDLAIGKYVSGNGKNGD